MYEVLMGLETLEILTIFGVGISVQLSFLLGYLVGQRHIAAQFPMKLQPPPKDFS